MTRRKGNLGEITFESVPKRLNGLGSYLQSRLPIVERDIVRLIRANSYLRSGDWSGLRKAINQVPVLSFIYMEGERLAPVWVVSMLASMRDQIQKSLRFIGEDAVLRRLLKEIESIEVKLSEEHGSWKSDDEEDFDFDFDDESSDLSVLGFYKAWMAYIYLFFVLSMKFGARQTARDLLAIMRDVPRFFGQLRNGRIETIPSYSMAKKEMERRAREDGRYEDEFEKTWVRVAAGMKAFSVE